MRARPTVLTLLAAAVVVLGACSGSDDDGAPADTSVASTATATSAESDAAAEVAADEPAPGGDAEDDAVEDEGAPPAEPAVRLPVDPDGGGATNWVGRTFMDDTRVELTWSEVAEADAYQLYRLPTADADYAAISDGVLEGATLIYDGTATSVTDDDVPVDIFLTYVLVADVGGVVTEPRWTEALTTPDTTPPSGIDDLEATVTDDGVLLTWSASTDDVEFAAYAVTFEAEDGSLQYIGGGAEENQTSFLDTDPRPGVNRYEVTAFDFHENGSRPAQVEIVVE